MRSDANTGLHPVSEAKAALLINIARTGIWVRFDHLEILPCAPLDALLSFPT